MMFNVHPLVIRTVVKLFNFPVVFCFKMFDQITNRLVAIKVQ